MAAEMRRNHRLARVMVAPDAATRSLSFQIRDCTPPFETKAPARSGQVVVVR